MRHIKFISISAVILLMVFAGCLGQNQVATPTPTATPTPITVQPTVVETTPPPTPPQVPSRTPVEYKSFVDSEPQGFYKVSDLTSLKPAPYDFKNKTLSVYAGDKVIWVNDATPDEKLTIISEQDLWSNTSAVLRWNYQSFNYTFSTPGTFTVRLKEYPRVRQTIVVNP